MHADCGGEGGESPSKMGGDMRNLELLTVLAVTAVTCGSAIAAEPAKQEARNICVLASWDKEAPAHVVPPKLIEPRGLDMFSAPAAEVDKWLAEYRKIYGDDVQIVFGRGTVTKMGAFKNIEVLCAAPNNSNDDEYEAALASWRFEPARKRKRPVDYPNYPVLFDFTPRGMDPKTCRDRPVPRMRGVVRVPIVAEAIVRADEIKRIGGEAPVYPQAALDADQEGTVVVRFNILQSGGVQDPHVVCATMPGIFDDAALAAIRTWRFSLPARKPFVRAQIDVIFVIPEEEEKDDGEQ
jgi:TonB family protein